MDKLESSNAMPKFCCITHLISFMMNEADKLIKGSVQKDYFSIVHNALMLTKERKESTGRDTKSTYIDGCFQSIDCRMGLLMLAGL